MNLQEFFFYHKREFKCKSRGMGACLHTRGAALNAREAGIYRWIHQFAIEYTKMYFCEKSLL